MKKVLLIDDHPLILESLKLLLQDHPDFHVISSTSNPDLAEEFIEKDQPDILVLDVFDGRKRCLSAGTCFEGQLS